MAVFFIGRGAHARVLGASEPFDDTPWNSETMEALGAVRTDGGFRAALRAWRLHEPSPAARTIQGANDAGELVVAFDKGQVYWNVERSPLEWRLVSSTVATAQRRPWRGVEDGPAAMDGPMPKEIKTLGYVAAGVLGLAIVGKVITGGSGS